MQSSEPPPSENEPKPQKTRGKNQQQKTPHLEHPRLEVGVKHKVDAKELPVARAVSVLPAPPARVLEVAVGGVGAGEEHVRGDVAEVGPELVKGLGGACVFFFFF